LTFSYSYLTQSDIFNLSQWKWFPSSTIGVSLSIPIFSGGQRYHAVKQAQVQADELELQRENTERQLRIGIRQSLGTMDTAMRTYDASKEALASAEKAYDIAVKSYQLGKSTLDGPQQYGTGLDPVQTRRLPGHLQLRQREGRPGADPWL
jgi:Outer membrane protein